MVSGSVRGEVSVPDLGDPPERLEVDVRTVRRLVDEQFPQWSRLPVEPVRDPGWDNRTFHLGEELLVRMPSAAEYALAVAKEHEWLPRLASRLPVPIPTVRGAGAPGAGYPFPWSVYGWLPGTPATQAEVADATRLAERLADFLLALRRVDAADGPQPGVHNWYRGGTLLTYDGTARRALRALSGHVDVDLATEAWEAALAAPWDGEDVWFHGDLAPGNLLLEEGRLAAVIDFGTCGVGDPSCDLAIAWTLLEEPGRSRFRDRLEVDEPSWARGRGWALWKTLSGLASTLGDEDADEAEAAELRRVYGEIITEFAG